MAKIVVDVKNPTDLAKAFKRSNALPIDVTDYHGSLAEAKEYAKSDPTALVGQLLRVIENNVVTIYYIDVDGSLKKVGSNSDIEWNIID